MTKIILQARREFKLDIESPYDAILYENVNGSWVELAQGPVNFLENVHLPAEIASGDLAPELKLLTWDQYVCAAIDNCQTALRIAPTKRRPGHFVTRDQLDNIRHAIETLRYSLDYDHDGEEE